MLQLAHALTLGKARSHVAALADHAGTIRASIGYDRVLLELDLIHGDDIPAISAVSATSSDELFSIAESAIRDLPGYGIDPLTIELVLDLLNAARDLDVP